MKYLRYPTAFWSLSCCLGKWQSCERSPYSALFRLIRLPLQLRRRSQKSHGTSAMPARAHQSKSFQPRLGKFAATTFADLAGGRGSWCSGDKVITPMGISRAASNLHDQSAFYQRSKTSSSWSRGDLNSLGNLRSGETSIRMLGQCREDHFVSSVLGWGVANDCREGHAKMRPNLLKPRGVPSAVPAGRGHSLDTALHCSSSPRS